MDALRAQYERFPYPPVPWLALPRRGQGAVITFERGIDLCGCEKGNHDGIRILVAGAGTFEALLVAQAHPRAREVVAVDFSERALRLLHRREVFSRWSNRILRPWSKQAAQLKVACADLDDWSDDSQFDYVIASNVLHHMPAPAKTLAGLAAKLRPGGILRMVTYPKQSRIWMREAGRWLRQHGAPTRPSKALACMELLDPKHPARLTFETHPERFTETGIKDAFLNERENPLSPLEWAEACAAAGLSLKAEDQDEGSRSRFLEELLPETKALSVWEKLQILDDLLELCANPVLWLKRVEGELRSPAALRVPAREQLPSSASGHLPLHVRQELAAGLARAEVLLARCEVPLKRALETFRTEVGPRVSADGSRPLPGLAASDYDESGTS